LPDWIYNSNLEIKRAFLRRIYSCEGSIGFDKNTKRWELKYSMAKAAELLENSNLFLNQIKDLLISFAIKCSGPYKKEEYIRPKDNKLIIAKYLRISDKISLKNFYSKIKFDLPNKNNKLLETINI
jgi:intein/homing endonuclease